MIQEWIDDRQTVQTTAAGLAARIASLKLEMAAAERDAEWVVLMSGEYEGLKNEAQRKAQIAEICKTERERLQREINALAYEIAVLDAKASALRYQIEYAIATASKEQA